MNSISRLTPLCVCVCVSCIWRSQQPSVVTLLRAKVALERTFRIFLCGVVSSSEHQRDFTVKPDKLPLRTLMLTGENPQKRREGSVPAPQTAIYQPRRQAGFAAALLAARSLIFTCASSVTEENLRLRSPTVRPLPRRRGRGLSASTQRRRRGFTSASHAASPRRHFPEMLRIISDCLRGNVDVFVNPPPGLA